jgi:hypothetical protein
MIGITMALATTFEKLAMFIGNHQGGTGHDTHVGVSLLQQRT